VLPFHPNSRRGPNQRTPPGTGFLTQALGGFSESNRDLWPHDMSALADAPVDQKGFVDATEREDKVRAVNLVRSLLATGNLDMTAPLEVRPVRCRAADQRD
jgi:hypothetical protein